MTTETTGTVLPAEDACRRARLARDPRFDGRFVVGVLTTGVFCRPACPAPQAAEDNVRYFATSAAALHAGYRPCLRCRPERTQLPAWTVGSDTVIAALRSIEEGFLDHRPVRALALRLGLGERHLNRLFVRELGATPRALARMQRIATARRLLDDTDLPISDVALCAGYGSLRRCNDELRRVFGRAPRELRRGGPGPAAPDARLRLPVHGPWNAHWMFPFLSRRAVSTLEEVSDRTYTRHLEGGDITVTFAGSALHLHVPAGLLQSAATLVARMRGIFDLDADSAAIDAHLGRHPDLAPAVRAAPGIRVPGVWHAFEGAVKAVLGQQVTVDRAVVLATRLVDRYGEGVFPTPEALADADVASIGMPGARGRAVRGLARAVLERGASFLTDAGTVRGHLLAIDGIGPWTAEYIAMRVARDPDAFPASDRAVMNALDSTARAAEARSRAWRPWRAYAVMYLWHTPSLPGGAVRAPRRPGAPARGATDPERPGQEA